MGADCYQREVGTSGPFHSRKCTFSISIMEKSQIWTKVLFYPLASYQSIRKDQIPCKVELILTFRI